MRTYAQAKEFAQQQHRSGSSSWHPVPDVLPAVRRGSAIRRVRPGGVQRHSGGPRHQTSPPPAGSIAYYGFADHGAGHAVFAVNGGFVWSNDILRRAGSTGCAGTCSTASGSCPSAAGSTARPRATSCRCSGRPARRAARLPPGPQGLRQQDAAGAGRLRQRLEPAGGADGPRLRVRGRADRLLRPAHPAIVALPAAAGLGGPGRRRHRRAADGRPARARLGRR